MKKNTVKKVVALAVIAVLALCGYLWYGACVRNRADAAASDCLRRYYKAAGDGSPSAEGRAALKGILAEMEAVSPKCSATMANALFERRLDGAFLIGDYARAEAMMDELKGYTENWKTGAKAKIRAHAALQKNDKATALKEFGIFVETLVKNDKMKDELDPLSGIAWTRNGLLARNKKRMAELAADIGQKAEALKLRAEAKAHYRAAIAEAEANGKLKAKAELEKDAGSLLK